MALRERYKPKLQNSVYLAGRAAVKELGSHSASDWSCRRSSSVRQFHDMETTRILELPSGQQQSRRSGVKTGSLAQQQN
jgi:hypothetical protein